MEGLKSCEILAPAGSFECMKAAFCAGADAVYAGGSLFGARAFAKNFLGEELVTAIKYAHIHGRKFYLTVNTLLKDKELEQELFDYLKPLYQAGLDAVIVQDYGVMVWIHEHFPKLPIHASTQMNVTGVKFSEELLKYGVTRVVTARELSLKEIHEIYDKTGLEIESFVHGALCYGYSGQCLFSSMNGGRSGNRGKCAQPCRLAYDVIKDNKILNGQDEKYILSPKDLCTLEILPDILEAGVYSLKIEGRMKKPEYVASVTAMYRKYVDLYQKKGREGYKVASKDIDYLREIYNRGGFTDGYYKRHNGREMMSVKRPNHCGIEAGKIIRLGSDICIKTSIPLDKGDVLEFDAPKLSANYTIGSPVVQNTQIQIRNKFQNEVMLSQKSLKSMTVFRIRNNKLIDEITKQFIQAKFSSPVKGKALFIKEYPAKLELFYQDIHIEVYGQIVEQASKRPLTVADIEEKLKKTGETEFFFEELTIQCDEGIFYSLKELNDLRRKAFDKLLDACIKKWYRNSDEIVLKNQSHKKENDMQKQEYRFLDVNVSVLVSTKEQFLQVINTKTVHKIYLELANFSYEVLPHMIEQAHKENKKIYLALPYIFRTQAVREFENEKTFFQTADFDGFLCRNMEEYFFCRKEFSFTESKDFIFDSTIYCYNQASYEYLQQYQPLYISGSLELNAKELELLKQNNMELMLYGAIPVLFSAGCIKKTLGQCNHQSSMGEISLKSSKGEFIMTANNCRYCYNMIYHTKELCLFDEKETILQIKPASLRLSFTFEGADEVKKVLGGLQNFLKNNEYEQIESDIKELPTELTKGHFRRGVQ